MNNDTIEHFIALIDIAISIANDLKLIGGSSERIDASIDILKKFSNLATSGKLPRISTRDVPEGTGLGLVRGIGEWIDNEELLDAVYKVEEYYKRFM